MPDTLGEFELHVLLSVLRLGPGSAYTVSIGDDIEGRTGRSVRGANVYTTLQRLESKGYVTSRLGEPRPERGGRARRLVRVTPAGLAAVRSTHAAMRAVVGDLDALIGEV